MNTLTKVSLVFLLATAISAPAFAAGSNPPPTQGKATFEKDFETSGKPEPGIRGNVEKKNSAGRAKRSNRTTSPARQRSQGNRKD